MSPSRRQRLVALDSIRATFPTLAFLAIAGLSAGVITAFLPPPH